MGASFLNGPLPELALLVIVPVVAWRGRRGGRTASAIFLQVLFWAWLTVLVDLAFFPLPLPPYERFPDQITYPHGWPYPWVSLFPFETIRSSLEQGWSFPAGKFLVGNIGAFVPLGLLGPLLSPRWRSWGRALLLGLGASLIVEGSQLLLSVVVGFPLHVADVDDLLLNTTGTVIGFGFSVGGSAVLRRARGSASGRRERRSG